MPLALAFVQRPDGHENRTSSETRHGGRLETDGLGKVREGVNVIADYHHFPSVRSVLPRSFAAPRGRSPDVLLAPM